MDKLDHKTECKFSKDRSDMLPIFYPHNQLDRPFYLQTNVLPDVGLCLQTPALPYPIQVIFLPREICSQVSKKLPSSCHFCAELF